MTTSEILTEIQEQMEVLATEDAKTSKAAMGRARSAATKIKQLTAEYKRASLIEQKG